MKLLVMMMYLEYPTSFSWSASRIKESFSAKQVISLQFPHFSNLFSHWLFVCLFVCLCLFIC
jgi:hypothetical protein